ncbi:MAG: N-acetylneuraminate synthase family protein [Pseudobdellovibrio sp.]
MSKWKNRNKNSVYVIAEVGINHNGDMQEAKDLIKLAYEAGADAAKIQVRNLEEIYTKSVLKDPLLAEQGTQYLLTELKKAHLTYDNVRELFDYSSELDIDFFATPFDIKSAHFLNELGVDLFKIGSPDFSNLPLIKTVSSFGKPVILSTGMSDEDEIERVIKFLKSSKADFSLLHCNSTYPASYEDINLRYIPVLKEVSGVEVGYSGHEQGYGPTLASLGLGARIIERHITKDRAQSGPDHSSSLTAAEFKKMVSTIREVELSLGEPRRTRSQGELNNKLSLAKSLVASKDLKKGTVITYEDLVAKTPAKGISPLELDNIIGKRLARDVSQDDYVYYQDFLGNEQESRSAYQINQHWGIVGRLNDFRDYIDLKPKLIEIHMTWRDIFSYKPTEETFSQDLVVHAPEYYQDRLIDFSTDDKEVTEYSIEMLRKTIDIARDLNKSFKGQTDSRGPRVVVHPGGHFSAQQKSNKSEQYRLLKKNLKNIDSSGVRLLVENMPPYPWYFGGQWYNSIFMDAKEIAQFAEDMSWHVCYDTSHALLYCNSVGISLSQFTKDILKHTGYLHLSDAKGTTEEGLQLGKGNLKPEEIAELLSSINVGFIPEIWQGHLNRGEGFKEALCYLEVLLNKSSGKTCTNPSHSHYGKI